MSALVATNGYQNRDFEMGPPELPPASALVRFATGHILPPPDIKSVIDRTANFVAKSANPPQFEDKIRENQRSDPKFSFLNPADPYHSYYRHRMQRIALGETDDVPGPGQGELVSAEPVIPIDIGLEPPSANFILELPNISAVDLDTMKLTALFTARRGRSFLASLSAREGRNYQFDFLRPTHSLFGYFNRLVEQYTRVLYPSADTIAAVKEAAAPGARWSKLETARKHAKWERNKRENDKKRQDDTEAEKLAFAEIDWHDYAIVQTIEFTAADANSELPPPMTVQEVESMTLAQKSQAARVMEDTQDEIDAHRARLVAEAEAAARATAEEQSIIMANDPNEENIARRKRDAEERIREMERAKAMQASSASTQMKIRTDYVPKLGAKAKASTTPCSICGQQIPVDDLQEHMRIELLDPRWKSQRDVLEARKAQASELQHGANVASSLKNLARTRVDIFGAEADEEKRKRDKEEEELKRRERERVVWDGHTSSKAGTLDKFSTNVNFDEQIAAIHRAKGLGPQETGAMGPGIGPSAGPSNSPAPSSSSVPMGHPAGGKYSAATVSSGPQPSSVYGNPSYQESGYGQYQPPPTGGSGTGMHPSRLAAMGGQPGGASPQLGTVRNADEMEGVQDDVPPAKRQRVAKLPHGQMYPEADWIGMHPHPISLQVVMTSDPNSKPEWKLDGNTVTIHDLPLNLLVSTLRDRIIQATGSQVSASKIRLAQDTKMLTNSNTIAFYNLEDEDVLILSVRDVKKK